ncbi:diguanylate cyclase [Nitrosomonas sp. wSCUT-2]
MEGLIVEPSRTYQKLLTSAIESGGLGTQQVSTGNEALTLLKQRSFDLVFIATHLQDMDGAMFSSQMRADSRTRQIPLVMITANEDKKLLDEAYSAGVTEIFAKHELDKITSYAAQFSRKKYNKTMSGRILYLEDNLSTANPTSKFLNDCGYTVDHYTSGEEGLQAFQDHSYDLVLTDILLKGKLNGHSVIKTIRNLENDKKFVPLLVFSVLNDATSKIELLRCGVNDYVSKPVIHEELLTRVNNLITSKKLLDKTIDQQHQMQELALKDQLTGLYNRTFLLETAPSRLSEATRHGIAFSLIVIDIDKFRTINEFHGYAHGDSVLKEIAATILRTIRKEDIAVRYGEDEFVLLLSHCDISNALIISEKIRSYIEKKQPAGLDISTSFGVTELRQNLKAEFSELLNAAAEAARQAKLRGGNLVVSHYL